MARKKLRRIPDSQVGTLIIIGGHEDKAGERKILQEVANRVGENGVLCIATLASRVGHLLWEDYRKVFRELGVKKITHLDVVRRHQTTDSKALRAVKDATAVFFTGGDQLRITSELGGTEIAERINEIYQTGGLIAGTSAGASVMSETMLVSGTGESTHRIGEGLQMAPGLGFVRDMIIDQHFAERGRIGRLLGAVAQNPKYLGIGIDENTAIIVEKGIHFRVIGAGAVYVLDAHQATDCNISEGDRSSALSIYNVRFHLMSEGSEYDILNGEPIAIRDLESSAA